MAERSLEARAGGACPRCGAPLGPPPTAPTIGRPFDRCACGGFVGRAGANEWDLLRPGAKLALVGRSASFALAAGLVPLAARLVAASTGGGPLDGLEALVWLAGGEVAALGWACVRLRAAIDRSRRRMADPMYRARLVEYELATSAASDR